MSLFMEINMLAYNSGRYPTKIKSVRVNSYEIWRHGVVRCWHTPYKGNENYVDVKFSESWLDYSNFHEDVVNMVGYGVKGFVLDKDILSTKGEKVYSKDTCCFVPVDINSLLLKSDKARGGCLIGVDFHKKTGKYRARHRGHLGLFESEVEAFYAYKEAKERYIKEVANKYKDQIDSRAYEALMKYEVNIDD